MTIAYPTRRPSIGDDGDTVLAADAVFGILPAHTTPDSADALIAYGYVWFDDDHQCHTLTADGIVLRDRWAEIRRDTLGAAHPYGPLTAPSPGEIADARGRDDVAVPLHWPYQRPTT